ncbi:membrane protein [Paucimonas lemoignei]|nr:membrane protein [Paucimonas lemoignei]
MMLNSANDSGAKSSILSFNKSTMVVWIAISLIVVETFSGALRFYFDQAGAAPLLYLPKVACLVMFALELRDYKAGRVVWLGMLLLMISSVLAMLHGASLYNIAFGLFVISPLLFGMVCSEHLIHQRRLFLWVIGLCLLASLVGVAMDKLTSVPWKGYAYSVGEVQLSANTAWSAGSEDRIAGFARVSNVLSILIAIYALYVAMFIRSRLLLLALSVAALYGIVLTTSKAPAGAYALTMGLLLISHLRWTTRIVCVFAVVGGLALPLVGLLYDFDMRTVSSSSDSLSSLYDRLINTWPYLVEIVENLGYGYTGAGFGLVGSPASMFPVGGAEQLTNADSSAMYLWAMFGVMGPLLYALQIPMFFALSNLDSRIGRALLAITFCCCLISWTTDMFEVTIANLFLGLGMGHVLSGKLLDSRKTARPQAFQLAPPATSY